MPFTRLLELQAEWPMIPPAVFPHEEHQLWHDCAECHPEPFNVKKKTTEHFEMKYILEGKFCGVCHLFETTATTPEADPCAEFLKCVLRQQETGSWREDFERICARTEDAAWLPREKLEELIRDSEALLETIKALAIPEAKIYVFRLEKCKAFFEYALELQDRRPAEEDGGGEA